ncbi:hypothetical protein [Brachyspira catarrhinii]|uniref:Uncharacterized protein n=1 Tax=Brachyspira catarrhinii TaxID=2528966 RepID=A0ABY2TPW4_9SPIR|nr:hypothetical protein [Brachyspira catarrhinii]TKZ30677.1 hypothetical protein EZH24_10365 [Brachyspira catarrhinii]
MKKIYLLFLLIISIFMMSCGGHFFNPRYYYNKSASESEQGEIPDTAPENPPEQVPEHEDPFKNGDWNDPNYGGYDGSKFKTWLFKASFQKDKLPIYTFFEDDNRYWISGVMDWNNVPANYYDGKDGENYAGSIVGNVSITGLKVYQYVANNPLYSKEGYLEGRLDRFNFYSINGKASVATLKQYLIAVDTYSKFIFAFGAITETQSVAGDEVPVSFKAVEKEGDRSFFEYDPIGYVKEDGTVVLYEHYRKEFVAAPTEYLPKIHPEFEKMAEHKENGQGSSPYLKVDVSTIDPSTVLNNFKDKQYGIRDRLTLYTYKFDSTANTLTLKAEHFYDGPLSTKTYTFSKIAGLTSAEYISSSGETIIVNGIDDYNKLKDGGSFEYILNYNDNGPLFYYRAAGKNYTEIDSTGDKYVFSGDGKSLYHYLKSGELESTYTYVSENGTDQATYKNGTLSSYTLRLATTDKKDDTLFWSSIWGSTADSYESIQDYVEINGGFTDYVSSQIFKYRDTSQWTSSYPLDDSYSPDGRSLILKTYTFSKGGTTLEIKEETWNKPKDTKTTRYNLTQANDKSASYTGNGGTISLEINDSGNLVQNYTVVGIIASSFVDNGPIFPDRVRGAVFKKGDTVYTFNEDGTSLTLEFEYWFNIVKHTYKLVRLDNDIAMNYTGIYHDIDWWTQLTPYKRLRLNKDSNDNTIVSSTEGGSINGLGSADSDLGLGIEAYRVTQ